MTAGLGLSAYIDVPAFQRSPHGQEIASLLGLNTTLAGAGNFAGATSLLVVSSTSWAAGSAWVLDGPLSEVVSITGSVDGTHVTIAAPGLQFAHAAGASLSQAGSQGALAEVILRASSWMEGFCQQGGAGGDRSLFAVARIEKHLMPAGRAYLSREYTLTVRPGHFPVQSVASLLVDLGQGQTLTLDTTTAELVNNGRTVEVPYLLSGQGNVGQQLFLASRGLSRSLRAWVAITYTGGFTPGAVPYDVQQAAVWMTADLLAQRQNPTGAAELDLGKRRLVQRQRGDLVGDSILLLRAHDALQPYRDEVW